jgi:hypothetical protein
VLERSQYAKLLSYYRDKFELLGNIDCKLHLQFVVWCMLTHPIKVKEPAKYSVTKKPSELNMYSNGVRSRNGCMAGPGHNIPPMHEQFPPPMPMPYGYYPSPYQLLPPPSQWPYPMQPQFTPNPGVCLPWIQLASLLSHHQIRRSTVQVLRRGWSTVISIPFIVGIT